MPAHGDFHVDQLLVGEEVAVVDFDQMCLAAPALDLATYAADVVRGRDGDFEAVEATLAALSRATARVRTTSAGTSSRRSSGASRTPSTASSPTGRTAPS